MGNERVNWRELLTAYDGHVTHMTWSDASLLLARDEPHKEVLAGLREGSPSWTGCTAGSEEMKTNTSGSKLLKECCEIGRKERKVRSRSKLELPVVGEQEKPEVQGEGQEEPKRV